VASLHGTVAYPKASPNNPLTEDELKAKYKYMDMASACSATSQADRLYRRARDLRRIEVVADVAALFNPK
jgi:hypothetical protein